MYLKELKERLNSDIMTIFIIKSIFTVHVCTFIKVRKIATTSYERLFCSCSKTLLYVLLSTYVDPLENFRNLTVQEAEHCSYSNIMSLFFVLRCSFF